MSKRLQVLFDEEELAEIQEIARRRRTTVAEWVRQALRSARMSEPRFDTGKKLEAVRMAARYDFPTGDIDRLLGEIEQGYLGDTPE